LASLVDVLDIMAERFSDVFSQRFSVRERWQTQVYLGLLNTYN
jgi:hypothetical protein